MSGADVLNIPHPPTARRAAKKDKYSRADFYLEHDFEETAPSPRAKGTKGTKPVRSCEEVRQELKQEILKAGMTLALCCCKSCFGKN